MARTLGYHSASRDQWHPAFRERWPILVADAGRAIADADAQGIREVRERLSSLVDDVGTVDQSSAQWPVYGALIINLRNTLDAMDEVAAANPIGQPPLPIAPLQRLGSRGRARLQSRTAGHGDAPTDA
jgi:hypothetical protein